ncbi:MAG: heme ABC transporter permease CcmC [Rhodocyclaceae bacterium]
MAAVVFMSVFRFSSPHTFYPLAGKLIAPFALLAAVLSAAGLYIGFFLAPADAVQGEVYRILYLHVASAWMSMFIYVVMALWSAVGLGLGTRLSFYMAQALAPTGALFCFIALWSGALWGRPTWGAYWVWDARLTSELLLLFLYCGYLALTRSIDDPRRADRAGALLALVGVVNVPIIYFSVRWWNTLHQGASLTAGKSSMAHIMLCAMLLTVAGCWCYCVAASLARVRRIILERERHTHWGAAEIARLGGAQHPAGAA